MEWIFILMDVVIFVALIFLCVLAAYLWNKHRPLSKGALSEFRNDDLYEKSEQERKRLAHIEDSFEDVDASEVDYFDEADIAIGDDDISFAAGYGGKEESEAENED